MREASTMREVTVAAVQMPCAPETDANVARACDLVRLAADQGANIVLVQELFEMPYPGKAEEPDIFGYAKPIDGHPVVARLRELAAELGVVLPVSVFERANNAHYNSLVMVDADGRQLGVYRKSHIPDGPGYSEKVYFNPGDTGFMAFDTRFGRLGAAVCWDQWFPESARAMALKGAEILFYPTAIGNEPQDSSIDSRGAWQRVMQGHAVANNMPVVAANRVGTEESSAWTVTFFGRSFITDNTGAIVAEAGQRDAEVITASFDLDGLARQRAAWGLFRDRRPELYEPLLTLDGATRPT
jgi:N-carbamoylputrescine amidase